MSSKTIAKIMSKDPEFVAKFVVAPKATLNEFGIDEKSLSDGEINALETLAEQSQDNIRTNAKLVGIEMATADWGIGAGCCNSKVASFGALARR